MNYVTTCAEARAKAAFDVIDVLACHHRASHHPLGSPAFVDQWECLLSSLERLAQQEILGPIGTVDLAPIEHLPDLVIHYEQFRDEYLGLYEGPEIHYLD